MYRLLFLFIVLLSSCRGLKNTPPPDSNLEESLKIKLDTSAKIDFIETDYTEKLNAIRTVETPTKTIIEINQNNLRSL